MYETNNILYKTGIKYCRLNLAAKLLCETEDSINAIAEKVGIPDIFYFSKLFKNNFNLAPSLYRKNCTGSYE